LGPIHRSASKVNSANFVLKQAGSLRIDEGDLQVKDAKQPHREVKHMNGDKGIYVGGTLISIVISLALYLTGRRESAIFAGLWAPTILNLGQSLLEED
jgi:CheY-specific phosphatase CheX